MAEETKKPVPVDADDNFFQVMGEIVVIMVVLLFLMKYLGVFNTGSIYAFFENLLSNAFVNTVLIILIVISNILSIVFLIGIIYSIIRLRHFEEEQRKSTYPEPAAAGSIESTEATKWQKVRDHISSANPADWRLAILEADIMLDDLLDKLGLVGDTMGDKLKKVNPGDFKTLDSAWEAHRIRNAIAHEGSDFSLTEREAKRVVGLYESIFKEFNFV